MTFGIASETFTDNPRGDRMGLGLVNYLDFLVEVISTLAIIRQNRITRDITLLSILLKLLFWRLIAPSIILDEYYFKIKHFSPLLR